jgi:hypothetical protein
MASHFSVSASWPVAMTKLNHERWMRMNLKIIACTRFHAFAILPGKLLRWGKATLNKTAAWKEELSKSRTTRNWPAGWMNSCPKPSPW